MLLLSVGPHLLELTTTDLFWHGSVVEFFKELPHFLVKVGPAIKRMYGDEWEKRLEVCLIQNLLKCLTKVRV